MGHYAKILNNKVVKVIVAEAEFFDTFVDDSPGEWVQTSYNTRGGVHYEPDSYIPSSDQSKALRKNFAGIGYVYDRERDAFYEPKVFDSFTLDEETCTWKAPTPYPNDGNMYEWNEENQQWDLLTFE